MAFDKKGRPTSLLSDRISALLSHANDIIDRTASKALSGNVHRHVTVKRAPRLSRVWREVNELNKIVEALVIRSIAQDSRGLDMVVNDVTWLDADVAYRLLDNPPEPNEAVRNLLALR